MSRESETNSLIGSVISRIVALQKAEAVDEVESLPGGDADVGNDQIYVAGISSDHGVERAWPNLSVRDEFERCLKYQREQKWMSK